MYVLHCNIIDILYTLPDWNVYNFISFFFFMKRSSYTIFSFAVFNSSGSYSTLVQTYVSLKSLIHATYHCIKWFSAFV